ncbi:hypothetical protein VPHK567_0077 [Vibrio phage K567]|nr:hypothetical protein MYOV011v1_p0128 [Vibrio phage 6E35.1a]
MISAKEAKARLKTEPQAVTAALEELDLAVQIASATKTRVDYRTDKLTESERGILRNKLISLGYDAFIAGEKLEVMW